MTKIVGILNITPDSFSDGGKFFGYENALKHLRQMLDDGADVIDVGAESTRPGAVKITAEEEWNRLKNILPQIVAEVKKEKGARLLLAKSSLAPFPQVSIDSYHYETIVKAHEMGVDIINDVSGLMDERVVDFIAKNNVTTVLMHAEKIARPNGLIVNPYININAEIIKWAKDKIAYLEKKGVKKSQLIFDPGIGFGKDADQSLKILKGLDAYAVLGLPLYIGHSKKSFLDKVLCEGDRASKTLLVSRYLMKKGVDFLRVHDVSKHVGLKRDL